jgi:hypothetical protein
MKTLLFHILTARTPSFLANFEGFLNPQKGPVRKNDFREDLLSKRSKSSYFQINLFLTLYVWYPLVRGNSALFTKMEGLMRQFELPPLETLPARVQFGTNAIRNYCTIAHITVLLVALAAKRSGHPDKIRYVRSFVPNFLPESLK